MSARVSFGATLPELLLLRKVDSVVVFDRAVPAISMMQVTVWNGPTSRLLLVSLKSSTVCTKYDFDGVPKSLEELRAIRAIGFPFNVADNIPEEKHQKKSTKMVNFWNKGYRTSIYFVFPLNMKGLFHRLCRAGI